MPAHAQRCPRCRAPISGEVTPDAREDALEPSEAETMTDSPFEASAADPHDTDIDRAPRRARPSAPLGRRILGVGIDAAIVATFTFAMLRLGAFGADAARASWLEPDDVAPLVTSGALVSLVITAAILGAALQAAGVTALGGSVGHRAVGLRLEGSDGSRLSLRRAAIRAGLAAGGALVMFVGPAWILLSPRQRALHDLLAGTRVVLPDDSH